MAQDRSTMVRLLAKPMLVLLAWVGLGTFSGCNLELARASQSGILSEYGILLGLIAGLLGGLAVICWNRCWMGQSVAIGRRFGLQLSYAGVCLLVAFFSLRADWRTAHNWTPVHIPFRFDKENTVSATFTADMSETYLVLIDLKRNLPFDDLNSFTGGWRDPEKPPHIGPPRPVIVWDVSNVREADRVVCWKDVSWGKTVGLEIGGFKAVAGQPYTITARVVTPSPKVQVLDPHLQVELNYILWPQYYVPAGLAQMSGMIAGVMGIGLVIYAIGKLRIERGKLRAS